jgi:hypothetical protein
MLLLPALAASVTIGLMLASAQGIPNKQIPAIAPAPPPKVLAPATVPGTQYECPTGYAKPDLLLRVQYVRICLPVGSPGPAPAGIVANPPGSTATAIPGQPAPRAPSSAGFTPPRVATNPPGAGARTVGRPVLACGGRTGFYACGRNAMECCPVTQDNPCFAGAYACKVDASQGGANMVCCLK